MWNIIGIILVAAGVALIWSVLVKKFPQLKLIDLSTMAKERHAEVKSRIMKARFERSLGAISGKTATVTAKASGRVRGLYERAYGSLKKMEARMDGGRKAAAAMPAPAMDVAAGLDEAQRAAQEERYEDAERMYIELLKRDAKHVDAYRGLAELYIDQKLYDQAAETLEFLLRLTGDDDRALGRLGQVEASRGNFQEAEARYLRSIELAANATAYRADLGRVYLAAGEAKKAQEQFRTALQAEPHHPKYLDYFLEASILVGDPVSAREALGALEEVNPENAKLADFRARIDAMLERA
ncbi:MAG TPA: tetratricopeptide repeat protein [Candidatus Baltobacteraceae bacterium]|nr:tetratricopeptide repeat protein [Candidatus Baltobacteraceae bacterium]